MPSVPLFSRYQVLEVQSLCGRFLLKLGTVDCKYSSPYYQSQLSIGSEGQEIIQKILQALFSLLNEGNNDSSDNIDKILLDEKWLALYGDCAIALCGYQTDGLRALKEARASLTGLIALLRSEKFSSVTGEVKGILFILLDVYVKKK